MTQGTISRIRTDKGFGFIVAGGRDYFFHATNVVDGDFDALRPGDPVIFETEDSAKGPRAVGVQRAS